MKYPRRLPIVEFEGARWFFDERLHQIRNVENPHDYQDLDEVELDHFRRRTKRRR